MARLNFTNYEFAAIRTEMVTGRLAYVLEVKPKRKDKYLFQGLIWVDAEDYALVRAEGSPAKNPSFWTKSTHFVQVYREEWPAVVSTLHAKRYRRSFLFGPTDGNIEYSTAHLKLSLLPRPLCCLQRRLTSHEHKHTAVHRGSQWLK